MSLTQQPLAYTDCYEVFDKALADPRGARVQMDSIDAATYFRLRLHTARKIDRQQNAEIYADDHPLCGRSTYDALTIRIRNLEDGVWVYLTQAALPGKLEALSEITDEAAPVASPTIDHVAIVENIKINRRI